MHNTLIYIQREWEKEQENMESYMQLYNTAHKHKDLWLPAHKHRYTQVFMNSFVELCEDHNGNTNTLSCLAIYNTGCYVNV